MTLAQFSRDDMLIYQGREEERQESMNRLAETCFKLNQSSEEAQRLIAMTFPDADSEYVETVIKKIYH